MELTSPANVIALSRDIETFQTTCWKITLFFASKTKIASPLKDETNENTTELHQFHDRRPVNNYCVFNIDGFAGRCTNRAHDLRSLNF